MYGTQLYRLRREPEVTHSSPLWVDRSECELVKDVPALRNTAVVFLNSTGAHGASIPSDAPENVERFLYQVQFGVDEKTKERLIAGVRRYRAIVVGHCARQRLPIMPIASSVVLGERVAIFHPDLVNLYGCRIGDDTKIGSFVEIQKNAHVGSRCKISSHTFICEGVTIEDEVFVGHGVMFINDPHPRATSEGAAADRGRLGRRSHSSRAAARRLAAGRRFSAASRSARRRWLAPAPSSRATSRPAKRLSACPRASSCAVSDRSDGHDPRRCHRVRVLGSESRQELRRLFRDPDCRGL